MPSGKKIWGCWEWTGFRLVLCYIISDWYKEATDVLAKYQSESVQAEQEKDQEEKKEIHKELEPELKKLKVKLAFYF